ncbi:MAG: PEP-CTERM sorting domain-containing protein [Proteobacteria bacterium]|nr:PEP-CTERM sorting domain-containing protein [Pseudomonadota bacterium]MBU1584787.1 PEP-CTERM sorting domain-containing protein [Pseudomonadota bacterium]MBU2455988.1 PEP-CTERM sorting domain-containing protein [Pseudomonadota bacterium]MBU2628649.1 PEP-CTERM sorting domain-containing protein [Pseudomonadota bacterium]
MAKRNLILLQIILSMFLVSSLAFAAPSIDGSMGNEWNGYQTVEDYVGPGGYVGPGYGGQSFDVEKIGLFIDDSKLYFGLQTGFRIKGSNTVDGVEGGDFALDFGSDGSFEFGFDYHITTGGVATVNLFRVNTWLDPNIYGDSKPWKMNTHEAVALASTADGSIDADFGYTNDGDGKHYTLEASVDLDVLINKLNSIYGGSYNFDSVLAHWTMECGNDILETKAKYNPTPEPATLLLFGMGLLGAGAFGRKRVKKEES